MSARILIIEDEAVVQVHLRRLLGALGHEVVGVAPSASRARELAERERPDLALVDVNLEGDADGITIAHELETRFGTSVIFVTAFVDDSTLARAGGIGAQGYIVKPFSEAQLKAALATALAARQRTGEFLHGSGLQEVLSKLGDAILLADRFGLTTFVNPLGESLLGQQRAELVGRPLTEVIPFASEKIRNKLLRWIEAGAMSPAPNLTDSIEILGGDGSRICVEVEILPLQAQSTASGWAILLHAGQAPKVTQTRTEIRQRLGKGGEFHGMIGLSEAMLALFERIERLAAVPWTVLIEGETGSGKELAARALHNLGPRSHSPFLAVNCAGLTDTLLESQLFGHRRGAFTGAVDHQVGVFEAADGGTLFLDEIGDISPALQKSLLRVLDDGVLMRVGESVVRRVDVRVLCATQRDLEQEVAAGRFRADLLFRLRGARLLLPPLRARGEDIVQLAERFVGIAAQTLRKHVDGFTDDALDAIRAYAWPGNVRELRSAIDHSALATPGPHIRRADLPPEVASAVPVDLPDEKDRLLAAIARAGGNRSHAAALLGISRATLYRRLAQFGLAED